MNSTALSPAGRVSTETSRPSALLGGGGKPFNVLEDCQTVFQSGCFVLRHIIFFIGA